MTLLRQAQPCPGVWGWAHTGLPALPGSEGTLLAQDATVGTRSSALVDEHETIFKKNPRRVVRPAGERCVGADMAGVGISSSLGWEGLSVQLSEPGAAPWALLARLCATVHPSRADYTKSVIDLRPEDLAGEGGSLGDRSKSVPGLNTELVRP